MTYRSREAYDLILDRRSVRKFSGDAPTREEIDALLDAAFQAPSSKSQFPCHYIVIDDSAVKDQILSFHTSAQPIKNGNPVVICVAADTTLGWNTWRDDAAAATMNLLHAANAIGLDGCWCGVYPRDVRVDGMIKTLGLPAGILPYSLAVIGHGLSHRPRPERRREERVHRNRW